MTTTRKIESTCVSMRQIDNLALEGGGVRGFFHLGVFLALDELGLLTKIQRIAGTSIGAFMGLAAALGYSAKEMEERALKRHDEGNVPKFQDFIPEDSSTHYPVNGTENILVKLTKNIYNTTKSALDILPGKGLFYGKHIENEVTHLIKQRFPDKENMSFKELHELKLQHPELHLKDLYVTAVNCKTRKLEIFSYETTPDMLLRTAIHGSMAVPGIYKPVEYQGNLYEDGGSQCNLPIRLFDDPQYISKGNLKPQESNMRTLGICITSEMRTGQLLKSVKDKLPFFIHPALEIALSFMLLQGLNHANSRDPLRTIYLDTDNVGVFDFNIKKTAIIAAIEHAKIKTFEYAENYIKNTPDPHTETLGSQLKQLKSVLKFYSMYMPSSVLCHPLKSKVTEMKNENHCKI